MLPTNFTIPDVTSPETIHISSESSFDQSDLRAIINNKTELIKRLRADNKDTIANIKRALEVQEAFLKEYIALDDDYKQSIAQNTVLKR
jgi:hypothetical protein